MTNESRIKELEDALEDVKLFVSWIECLGRTECEVYKQELKSSADEVLERINKALNKD